MTILNEPFVDIMDSDFIESQIQRIEEMLDFMDNAKKSMNNSLQKQKEFQHEMSQQIVDMPFAQTYIAKYEADQKCKAKNKLHFFIDGLLGRNTTKRQSDINNGYFVGVLVHFLKNYQTNNDINFNLVSNSEYYNIFSDDNLNNQVIRDYNEMFIKIKELQQLNQKIFYNSSLVKCMDKRYNTLKDIHGLMVDKDKLPNIQYVITVSEYNKLFSKKVVDDFEA